MFGVFSSRSSKPAGAGASPDSAATTAAYTSNQEKTRYDPRSQSISGFISLNTLRLFERQRLETGGPYSETTAEEQVSKR